MMKQPGGGGKTIQVMPEHAGCSRGTGRSVGLACDKWLAERGLKKTWKERQEVGAALMRARRRKVG